MLPFKSSGDHPDVAALAQGITEDIITGLSRFSYLRVISLRSTLRYTADATDTHTAGKELGARYVMEGSLRQVGARLRLAVQLVDADSEALLWAETIIASRSRNPLSICKTTLFPKSSPP